MPQLSIGERIKFLLAAQGGIIRKFARSLDVSDTNIRNYIERGTKPSSDTLEKLLQTIPHLNPAWLLTGEGEPFLPESGEPSTSTVTIRKNSGGSIGTNHGNVTVTYTTLDECQKDLETALEKITLLTSQLADKERTIQILLKQQP